MSGVNFHRRRATPAFNQLLFRGINPNKIPHYQSLRKTHRTAFRQASPLLRTCDEEWLFLYMSPMTCIKTQIFYTCFNFKDDIGAPPSRSSLTGRPRHRMASSGIDRRPDTDRPY